MRKLILIAILPMLPEYTLKAVEKGSLTFPVLNDPGNQMAGKFNLTHTLSDEL
jgi:hypothetical protein